MIYLPSIAVDDSGGFSVFQTDHIQVQLNLGELDFIEKMAVYTGMGMEKLRVAA